ncbi:ribosome silencing factor [Candidatus Fermentibacteria bacterium]|nr:ribosome silencing factor [Candidatus Fermentibacteria bacterium]
MAAATLAADELATDIVVLDLRTLSDVVDFFVIASSPSDMHLHAIASGIEDGLRHKGTAPHHREGGAGSRWILLDYIDVIVHLMHPSIRTFYSLEELWGDAPTRRVETRRLSSEISDGIDLDDIDA